MKYEIGNKVILKKNAPLYKSSNATTTNSYNDKDRETVITRTAKGSRHPYNTTGDRGWCDEKYLEEVKKEEKFECEMELIDKNDLMNYIKNHNDKIIVMSCEQLMKLMGW